MKNQILLGMVFAGAMAGEVFTLRGALERAMRQSPEVLLSRIGEQVARERVTAAEDPFRPKLYAGSGAAYSQGFPMSIEGSAPSIVQMRGAASVFDQSRRHAIAQAKEEARTAGIGGESRRERAAAEVIAAFLEAERLGRLSETAKAQTAAAERSARLVAARVEAGRDLPVENKRAALDVARARQRAGEIERERDFAEAVLGAALGLEAGERARPAEEDRAAPEIPADAAAAVEQALKGSLELRRLESALLAKGLEAKARRAERLPKVELVAQYGLFARFNNYEDFFRRFQRHNGQIGVSVQAPLLAGRSADAGARGAEAEAAGLRIELARTRTRIAMDAERAFQRVGAAETARQVARLDHDLAREEHTIALARMEEGRTALREVEQARRLENEKWMAYLDAQSAVERARYALLAATGGLMASVSRP